MGDRDRPEDRRPGRVAPNTETTPGASGAMPGVVCKSSKQPRLRDSRECGDVPPGGAAAMTSLGVDVLAESPSLAQESAPHDRAQQALRA